MHKMNVRQPYFNMMKAGTKLIELRLYDEKRQKIKIGDKIEFSCLEDVEDKIEVEVIGVHRATDFKELCSKIDIKKAGFSGTPEEVQHIMEEFYPTTEQQKYGVLGIEIKRI